MPISIRCFINIKVKSIVLPSWFVTAGVTHLNFQSIADPNLFVRFKNLSPDEKSQLLRLAKLHFPNMSLIWSSHIRVLNRELAYKNWENLTILAFVFNLGKLFDRRTWVSSYSARPTKIAWFPSVAGFYIMRSDVKAKINFKLCYEFEMRWKWIQLFRSLFVLTFFILKLRQSSELV